MSTKFQDSLTTYSSNVSLVLMLPAEEKVSLAHLSEYTAAIIEFNFSFSTALLTFALK